MGKNYSTDTIERKVTNKINELIKQIKALRQNQIGYQGYITLPGKSSDPSGAPDGSMYYNTSTPAIRVKINGTWKTVTAT